MIGPYDDTGRFWGYVKWMQRSQVNPIQIDEDSKTIKSSMVYSKDVVGVIMGLIMKREGKIGESYHLGFEERPTLKELLDIMVILAIYLGRNDADKTQLPGSETCQQLLSFS